MSELDKELLRKIKGILQNRIKDDSESIEKSNLDGYKNWLEGKIVANESILRLLNLLFI